MRGNALFFGQDKMRRKVCEPLSGVGGIPICFRSATAPRWSLLLMRLQHPESCRKIFLLRMSGPACFTVREKKGQGLEGNPLQEMRLSLLCCGLL